MNICFVSSRFPYPITKGDTLRAYHQIRELSRHHRVHLISVAEEPVSASALTEMSTYCERIDVVPLSRARSVATVALGLRSRLPLQVLYFRSPALTSAVQTALARTPFDVVHAMTIRVAPAVLAGSDVPVVVDFMDSYAANIATRRLHVAPVARRLYDLELDRVRAYETDVAKRSAGGIVIAELDRASIGDPDLVVIPNGVDCEAFSFHAGPRDDATLIFTGNMGYQPNVDAVTWFAAECWPALRARRPDLRFSIVGARPTAAVSALTRYPGIEVVGPVESMVPYLHRATVAVCPIRCGSGMQNKLLEAMAAGAPVVTTDFANRGIGAVAGEHLDVAPDAATFVDAVLGLLADPARRTDQAHAARAWVDATYSWSRHAGALAEVYGRAVADRTLRAPRLEIAGSR